VTEDIGFHRPPDHSEISQHLYGPSTHHDSMGHNGYYDRENSHYRSRSAHDSTGPDHHCDRKQSHHQIKSAREFYNRHQQNAHYDRKHFLPNSKHKSHGYARHSRQVSFNRNRNTDHDACTSSRHYRDNFSDGNIRNFCGREFEKIDSQTNRVSRQNLATLGQDN
jgi:hypothetical protein